MKDLKSNLVLVATSCLVALMLVEVVGRLWVEPCEGWYGSIFGVPLPPMQLVPESPVDALDRDAWYAGLVVDGRRITVGDVAGYHRYDPLLGYAPLEDTVSANGWWQANGIGAREMGPTSREVPAGQFRWLLLGESFAHGSGLPTSQGWAEVADRAAPGLDIVNLAVDGYSMAQAYLRYGEFADHLEHQGVLLMFVPGVDLWRDVNTLRDLGEAWKVRTVMPRFVLEGNGLRLVTSPYANPEEFDRDNRRGMSETLKDHLHRYDRFYFPLEHETIPVLGRLLTFKLVIAAHGRYSRGAVRREQLQVGSEALAVSRRLFRRLQDQAQENSREFVLLVLPTATDIARLRGETAFRKTWQEIVDYSCKELRHCVDLTDSLMAIPPAEFDLGPDGNHYGPRTNVRIARAVLAALAGVRTAER